jgi:hypothetical protein
VSAGGQFLLAANGHFHVRQWAFFHVRRQQTMCEGGGMANATILERLG